MTPEVALEKREQMIEEGFCVVDDVLTEAFLQELRDESERLIARTRGTRRCDLSRTARQRPR